MQLREQLQQAEDGLKAARSREHEVETDAEAWKLLRDVRLTIASQLKSAIILDDHLVQTDPLRLVWFRDMLIKTALETQVIVFTCRPSGYLLADELPEVTSCDFAGGAIRAVNLNGVVQRWEGARSRA